MLDSFERQKSVMDSCREMQNSLKDISKWEKEIKEKEKMDNEVKYFFRLCGFHAFRGLII